MCAEEPGPATARPFDHRSTLVRHVPCYTGASSVRHSGVKTACPSHKQGGLRVYTAPAQGIRTQRSNMTVRRMERERDGRRALFCREFGCFLHKVVVLRAVSPLLEHTSQATSNATRTAHVYAAFLDRTRTSSDSGPQCAYEYV